MKTVGLITEYNPFHKGHKYHIEEARRITGADCTVVIMSGNYVQRGEPAFFDKYLRTEIALEQGADLVMELPVLYATGSAELFAHGAVTIFNKLGCIDTLCFGSEHATVEELKLLADILAYEPKEYQTILQSMVKTGVSYPVARTQAILQYLQQKPVASTLSLKTLETILNTPNHILGIEYLKALCRTNSRIEPYTITRIHAGYHDTEPDKRFYSASALRSLENQDYFLNSLSEISPRYGEYLKTLGPVTINDFSLVLGEKLLSLNTETLTNYADVNRDFAHSIMAHHKDYQDYNTFISLLKSKNLTYTRISRSLLHIMLGITDELQEAVESSKGPSFVRVLGFNTKGRQLLGHISPEISLLTKMADFKKHPHTQTDCALFTTGIYADNLYRLMQMHKYRTSIPNEFTRKLITFP